MIALKEWQKDLIKKVQDASRSDTRFIITCPPRHGLTEVRRQLDEWTRRYIERG